MVHTEKFVLDLENKAIEIRRTILDMVFKAQSGHLGGSFSGTDLITCLYYHHMNLNPGDPGWENRDRFILSKGHAAPIVYAILSDLGYFPREVLKNFRQVGNILQGHPDRNKTPGIEMTAGSLGQGLSVGIGLALAAKMDKKDYRTYVLMGDGELDEGQVWEAAMFANKKKLNNIIAIVDYNGVQLDGSCDEIMPLSPLKNKWEAFGWRVLEVDGHNISKILDILEWADQITDAPVVILADTLKGKGVSFMENDHKWHGQVPTREQYEEAVKQLERGKSE